MTFVISKNLSKLTPSENPIVTLIPSSSTVNESYTLNSNVTIASSFNPIYAVENPINFALSSYVSGSSETFPQITFRVVSVPATGTTITISASTNVNDFPTYVLTAAMNGMPKFNEIYSQNTTPTRTTAEVADSIVFGLNSNFAFRQRFYAARNASDIVVKSLVKGSRFNLDFYSTYSGITLQSTSDSVDNYRGEVLKDYALWADLYINCTGDFGGTLNKTNSTRVQQFDDLWNTDNINYFGLNGVLKNFVYTPLPSATTEFQYLNGNLTNFYLVYGEKYDEFRSNYSRQFLCGQSEISWVINSSLPYLTENDFEPYTINNDDLLNAGTSTVPSPLTLQPNPKLTKENQKEYITILYHNYPEISSFNREFYLQVRAEYYDGSFSSEVIYNTTSIYSGGCYVVDVSPENIGINVLNFTNRVKRYNVRLCVSSNQYLGELQLLERVYTLDTTCEGRYPINTIFLNSVGGWDSWLFNGDTEIDYERKTSEFTSPLGINPSITDVVTQTTNVDVNRIYKANSGFIDRDHWLWLSNELSKCTEFRIIDDDGNYTFAVISKIDPKFNSDENLFKVEIEFKMTTEENYIRR